MTIFKGSVLLNRVKKEKENLRQFHHLLTVRKQKSLICSNKVCARVCVCACEHVHVHVCFLTSCQKLINVDFSVVEK